MRSRYYTKEIGVSSTERPLPNVVAYPILTILVVVAGFFVHQILSFQPAEPDGVQEPAALKVSSR